MCNHLLYANSMKEVKTKQDSVLAVMELIIQEREFMKNTKIITTEDTFFKNHKKKINKALRN